MKEFPKKFLSLRDKNDAHRRSKSVPPGVKEKSRPLSAETFRAMFKMDNARQVAKLDTARDEQDSKLDQVQRHLDRLSITSVSTDHIRDIMATKFADGDPARTVEFIDIEQKAQAGIIISYDPSVHMVGAENRESVTCYLDSLLFAMFAKLDAFECMLRTDFALDDPRYKLVTLLRIWVNLLRSGKLIRTDLTKLLQDSLAECGWPDAQLLEQQDTSEAFAFLTEALQLPLLSLQVDLFHHGKKDKDDHKVVYERLLNLAVPPDPEGKGVKLEDCLEDYFNARVDVLRDSEEGKKASADDARLGHRLETIRLVRGEEGEASSTATLSTSPMAMSPSSQLFGEPMARTSSVIQVATGDAGLTSDEDEAPGEHPQGLKRRLSARDRSTSVIQRIAIDDQGRPTAAGTNPRRRRRKGSTIVKAVTIPAWQFFRLIPWHALTTSEPRSDVEVAMNFDQRPIVGICLKRYAMDESGQPQRLNTFIDIPDSLRLPHFMLAGGPDLEDSGLSTEYKLVLQSVVCHRGDSLQSGHYIAFARVAPKLLTGNRRHYFDPPPDYEEAQWVQFDDMETENRVSFVDDIKQSLREEMPYLLFYQIVPMVDITCPSTEGTEAEPPSYNESKTSFEVPSSASTYDGEPAARGRFGEKRPSDTPTAEAVSSKPPSIRLSSEVPRIMAERPWVSSHAASTPGGSRRQSTIMTDSSLVTPAVTPDADSPVNTPMDDSAGSRLSRAASRFALGRQSRPASQSGEGRLSFSMTRLGGLMKSSKEPLAEPPSGSGFPAPASSTPAALPVSDPLSMTMESPADRDKTPAVTPGSHTWHKGGKSRDKSARQKAHGNEPERECSIM